MTASPRPLSNNLITDSSAVLEVATLADRRYCAIEFSESHMVEMCRNIDVLLGRSGSKVNFHDIAFDRTRTSYINLAHALERDTGLNEDLHWLLAYMVQNKNKIKRRPENLYEIYRLVQGWARLCPFEPKWHMRNRGDTKRLPNKSPNNLWGYLLGLYTDPHESIRCTPDWVIKKWNSYPGYHACVTKAVEDGQAWLVQAYGENVDLTPRADPVIQQTYSSIFSRDALLDGSILDSIRGA